MKQIQANSDMATTVKKSPTRAASKTSGDTGKQAKAPAPKSGTAASAVSADQDAGPNLVRRKELVARIVAKSGLKPNAVKTVLDAVLKEIGDILSDGDGLNVPPLGKLVVTRRKDISGAQIVNCKLRRKTTAPAPSGQLEEASAAR
jgi:DNA-binding protein HU-alpha